MNFDAMTHSNRNTRHFRERKMAKAKRKQQPAMVGDFTDALRAGEGWADVRTPSMPGEVNRTALHTRRRSSRACRWKADGWIDERGASAIMRFELLVDACCYDSVRSCCDNTVRGGGGGLPFAVVRARHDRAIAANAVADQVALMAVVEMLASEDAPEAVRKRLFGVSGECATNAARRAVRAVGGDLAAHFGA